MDEIDDQELPSVEDFDQSKERLKQLGCTCENMITGWEDGGDTWYWFSQHEDHCDLWLASLDFPIEND